MDEMAAAAGSLRDGAKPGAADPDCVDDDLACRGCGYNLRTRAWDAPCPECGLPVARSRLPGGFLFQSWRAIRWLRTGLYMVVIGILTSAVVTDAFTLYL